jgi:hypothetical protein
MATCESNEPTLLRSTSSIDATEAIAAVHAQHVVPFMMMWGKCPVVRSIMGNRRNEDVGIRLSRHNAESRRRVGIKYTYAGRRWTRVGRQKRKLVTQSGWRRRGCEWEICQMDEGTNGRSSGKREAGIGSLLAIITSMMMRLYPFPLSLPSAFCLLPVAD